MGLGIKWAVVNKRGLRTDGTFIVKLVANKLLRSNFARWSRRLQLTLVLHSGNRRGPMYPWDHSSYDVTTASATTVPATTAPATSASAAVTCCGCGRHHTITSHKWCNLLLRPLRGQSWKWKCKCLGSGRYLWETVSWSCGRFICLFNIRPPYISYLDAAAGNARWQNWL